MSTPVPLDSTLLRALMTGVLIVAFVAIAIWAYSTRRRSTFDALSRMPLEEDSLDEDSLDEDSLDENPHQENRPERSAPAEHAGDAAPGERAR